jgi:hypothetical protein
MLLQNAGKIEAKTHYEAFIYPDSMLAKNRYTQSAVNLGDQKNHFEYST